MLLCTIFYSVRLRFDFNVSFLMILPYLFWPLPLVKRRTTHKCCNVETVMKYLMGEMKSRWATTTTKKRTSNWTSNLILPSFLRVFPFCAASRPARASSIQWLERYCTLHGNIVKWTQANHGILPDFQANSNPCIDFVFHWIWSFFFSLSTTAKWETELQAFFVNILKHSKLNRFFGEKKYSILNYQVMALKKRKKDMPSCEIQVMVLKVCSLAHARYEWNSSNDVCKMCDYSKLNFVCMWLFRFHAVWHWCCYVCCWFTITFWRFSREKTDPSTSLRFFFLSSREWVSHRLFSCCQFLFMRIKPKDLHIQRWAANQFVFSHFQSIFVANANRCALQQYQYLLFTMLDNNIFRWCDLVGSKWPHVSTILMKLV